MATRYVTIGLPEDVLGDLDRFARHYRNPGLEVVLSRSNAARALIVDGLRRALKGQP